MEYLHPNFNVLEYDEQQGLFRKVSGVEDMCITNKKKTTEECCVYYSNVNSEVQPL